MENRIPGRYGNHSGYAFKSEPQELQDGRWTASVAIRGRSNGDEEEALVAVDPAIKEETAAQAAEAGEQAARQIIDKHHGDVLGLRPLTR